MAIQPTRLHLNWNSGKPSPLGQIFQANLACGGMLLAVLILAGCGAPGEPVPPRPEIPVAIRDLTLQQQGTKVALMFSLANERTTEGRPFQRTPDIEIYREVEPLTGQPTEPAELMYTIPGYLMDTYGAQNQFVFTDPLRPDDFARFAGHRLVYAVRASFSARYPSGPSNLASLQVYPPPEPPAGLSVEVAKRAIELKWTAPTKTITGAQGGIVGGYRVYRAEVMPGEAADALAHKEDAKFLAPFSLLGVTPSTEYSDASFQFGHAYLYTVRAVAQISDESVQSDESAWVSAEPKDVFPPSAPRGLEAAGLPPSGSAPLRVELSWEINPEPDTAGYNVYRKRSGETRMQRLNQALLPTPVYRDTTVEAGQTYIYQVTAVSKAGVESPASSAAAATAPGTAAQKQ